MFKLPIAALFLMALILLQSTVLCGELYNVLTREYGDKVYYSVKNNSNSVLVCVSKYVYRKAVLRAKFLVQARTSTIWKIKPKGMTILCVRK